MALNEEQAKAYMHKLLSTMVAQKGSDQIGRAHV